jgi:D-alanyl-D-alanine carboxypeptidase/D-alanyl-D-alanine-endopeptidase (penicillin-binding protein 4)
LGGNRGGAASYGQIVNQYLDAIKEKGIKKLQEILLSKLRFLKRIKSKSFLKYGLAGTEKLLSTSRNYKRY